MSVPLWLSPRLEEEVILANESDDHLLSDDESSVFSEESVTECNIHEITGKPLTETEFGECPICYEEMTMINVTITRCGHVMHSSCIFTALEKSSCCPMCRTQVTRNEGEDEEEEEEEEEEDDDDNYEYPVLNSSEEEDKSPSVEQLANKLQNMGYTMADVLTMFFSANIKQENKQRYTTDFLQKIDGDIDGILDGSIPLSARDTRSYAEVVKMLQSQQVE